MSAAIHDGLTNQQRWFKRHGERAKAIRREKMRRWRAEHPEESRAQTRASYARHLEARREQGRIHSRDYRRRVTSTEEYRLRERLRKQQRRGNGFVSKEEWLVILERFAYRCAYCGRRDLPLEMDHIFPLARGGRHEAGNIVPACKPCNASKGARVPAT